MLLAKEEALKNDFHSSHKNFLNIVRLFGLLYM